MDDFIMLEPAEIHRLDTATIALKLAMIATLGPDAMNMKKFQPWQEVFIALGLKWDLRNATVSMPQEKINKAKSRVRHLLARGSASRNDMETLFGDVAACHIVLTPCTGVLPIFTPGIQIFPHFWP